MKRGWAPQGRTRSGAAETSPETSAKTAAKTAGRRATALILGATLTLGITLGAALTGCAAVDVIETIPADADGTYNRVAGGTLVVGVSPNGPWVSVDKQGAKPGGPEPALLERFAEEIGAQIEWRVAAESELAKLMEQREIDVAIGGFPKDVPWEDSMALTRPYKPTGGTVMGVGLGENRMLVELERFLAREAGELK